MFKKCWELCKGRFTQHILVISVLKAFEVLIKVDSLREEKFFDEFHWYCQIKLFDSHSVGISHLGPFHQISVEFYFGQDTGKPCPIKMLIYVI